MHNKKVLLLRITCIGAVFAGFLGALDDNPQNAGHAISSAIVFAAGLYSLVQFEIYLQSRADR